MYPEPTVCPLPSWMVVALAAYFKTHMAVEMLLSVRTAVLTLLLGLSFITLTAPWSH